MSRVVVFCDSSETALRNVSLEMTTGARCLANELGAGVRVYIWNGTEEEVAKLSTHGADEIALLDADHDMASNPEAIAKTIAKLAAYDEADILLLPHTSFGFAVAPHVAALLDAAYVPNVVAIDGEQRAIERESYSGKIIERVSITAETRLVATVRPKAVDAVVITESCQAKMLNIEVSWTDTHQVVRNVAEQLIGQVCLTEADYVVGAGRGVRDAEGFALVARLSDVVGAALGATRAVIDEGFLGLSNQIGQTGKAIAPELYIACGISGSIQHMAGASASKCILAINNDPEAPIFKYADYGIVADLRKAVPLLIEHLAHKTD
ncbi:MAG: electron transfer flavoprotein subunit alpha/FixB family protein [Coriobacteriia bacterium]|nr:electron transfer flavoprotein subunit alpha/FixB family protein [Coriobacteriia bacterium]MCL2749644.1 electron transfer flavoprotein subunit alpha/FixB family protein [Coriobacteriia bacterium]